MNKVDKIAFIYLIPLSGEYQITDDLGYDVQRRPQLGFQYLCAILKQKGVQTSIFDQTIYKFRLDQLVNKLKEYDLVGFYCSDCHEDKVKQYCKEIKKKLDIPVLVGGPSTLQNSTFLDHGCDIVVHGEGEITLQQIIDYYNKKRDIKDIKGISYKEDGQIIKAPVQDMIQDLDQLPFPDRSKVNIKHYYDYFLFGMRTPYVTMIASRGCPNRCTYCTSHKIWGMRYRKRSVDNLLSEIDEVVDRYNVKYVSFQDDMFGLTNDWLEEFCQKLIHRPYRIKWMAIIHPFSIRNDTERMLVLMRNAGCDTLSFGLQTAHPEILKNINRHPAEPQQLKKIIAIAKKLGFVTAVSYIFGLPGDTKETIQTTIDYSLNCCSTLANYYTLSILNGSDIALEYKDKKITDLSEQEITKLTVSASKKFYTRPSIVLNIAYFIVKNPRWIVKIIASLPSVLAKTGLVKAINIRQKKKGYR